MDTGSLPGLRQLPRPIVINCRVSSSYAVRSAPSRCLQRAPCSTRKRTGLSVSAVTATEQPTLTTVHCATVEYQKIYALLKSPAIAMVAAGLVP